MTLPASLMSFGIFRALSNHLSFPFTPVENVLVQTVAGSMALMPLGCGFVGVITALNYLLKKEEQTPKTTWGSAMDGRRPPVLAQARRVLEQTCRTA